VSGILGRMNEDVITDLKQFIGATLSQQLAEQDKRFDAKIDTLDQKLSQKIDNLTAFVTETFDTTNDANEERFVSAETRLTKLEQTAA
jgi:hypothetical protein